MTYRPAETIRTYLHENGSEVQVPFHHLLTTWQLDDGDDAHQARIRKELREAGIEVETQVAELGPDDEVLLRVAPPPEDAASEEAAAVALDDPASAVPLDRGDPGPPPWQSELAAASMPSATRVVVRQQVPHRLRSVGRDLIALMLIALSGGLAAGAGYLLGKGF
jgi:hypothetical protein